MKSEPGLVLSGVFAGYGKQVPQEAVLRGLDLSVGHGEIWGLVGLNGSGKSTLLRVVAGHLGHFGSPDEKSSTVKWNGADLEKRRPASRIKNGILFLAQDKAVFGQLTVGDNLRIAARSATIEFEAAVENARRWWPAVEQRLGTTARVLSAGEYRLLSLSMASSCSPRLLLLDEPLAGLHAEMHDKLAEMLDSELAEKGGSAVVAEQDLVGLKALKTSRVALLSEGKIAQCWDNDAWTVQEVAEALAAAAFRRDQRQ